MPYIVLDKKSYHYEVQFPRDKEPKKTVLFVHGAGGDHKHWSYQIEHIGKDNMAIAIDLPGHGESEDKSRSSISEYATFIRDFTDHLLGHPFVLVGHSMGGAIAMEFAKNHPGYLNGLVLVGTGARLKVAPQILETFRSGQLLYQLIDYLFSNYAPEDLKNFARNEMSKVSPEVYYNDFSACNNFDVAGELDKITTKTLVISAENDILTPVKYGQFLQDNITGSEMKTIQEAGHMMMLEKPGDFNSLLDDFLEKL